MNEFRKLKFRGIIYSVPVEKNGGILLDTVPEAIGFDEALWNAAVDWVDQKYRFPQREGRKRAAMRRKFGPWYENEPEWWDIEKQLEKERSLRIDEGYSLMWQEVERL